MILPLTPDIIEQFATDNSLEVNARLLTILAIATGIQTDLDIARKLRETSERRA